MTLFIGLMSGTSLDGVDGVLVDWPPALPAELAASDSGFDAPRAARLQPQVLAFSHHPFPAELRSELLALNRPGENELHRAALAANALMRVYAATVAALLAEAGCGAEAVCAIGAHGQTVRHRPGEFDGCGYTVQLANGALLAELTTIDVVCDFRSRDVAAGGQGAPLVPAFHAACFAQPGRDVAVLNLGGIANLSLLPASGPVRGFDCGPGNVLMDLWCQRHLGRPYDVGGRWAAAGQLDRAWLAALLDEPYFSAPPPKSTGRDLFDADWLAQRLPSLAPGRSAQDAMRTLLELTAVSVARALMAELPRAEVLHVCGGGAFNAALLQRLQALCPGVRVHSSAESGLPPDQVEALAFAWLAQAALLRQPGSLAAVTGARGPRVLGAVHAARAAAGPAAG